jgi:sortase A
VTKVVRGIGWTLIAAGCVLLLYVIYLLFYTNLTTDRAQAELRDTWTTSLATDGDIAAPEVPDRDTIELGDAYAVIWFDRPGSDEPIVRDGPLFVVEGVSLDVLRRGPGHYPDSAAPGEAGNFAVAGHRTTYGAPFFHLDELRPGDHVYAMDRSGDRFRYVVTETRIVSPGDVWVVGDDPLDDGEPLLTLTTCHPRFSAAQRLVVFAALDGQELVERKRGGASRERHAQRCGLPERIEGRVSEVVDDAQLLLHLRTVNRPLR